MTGYIYFIENLQNHKKYIGQTTNIKKREYEHFRKLRKNEHINQKLQNAFNKYGEENFVFFYHEFKFFDIQELNELEKAYIQKFDSYNHGYNLSLGGEGYMPEKYKFDFENYAIIRAGCSHFSGLTNIVAKQENCSNSLICSIKNGEGYTFYHKEYETIDKEEYLNKFIKRYKIKVDQLPVDIRRQIFKEEEVPYVLAFLEIFPDSDNVIIRLKQCGKNTISRLKNGNTHATTWNAYQNLDLFQKEIMALEYKEKNNLTITGKGLPISLIELYVCFAAYEIGKTGKEIADHYNLKYSTVRAWLNHNSRKKEYQNYLQLSPDIKEKIKSLIWP